MLEDENSSSTERKLDNVINCPDGHQDFESFSNRGSSSQEIEIRNIDNRNMAQLGKLDLQSLLRPNQVKRTLDIPRNRFTNEGNADADQ